MSCEVARSPFSEPAPSPFNTNTTINTNQNDKVDLSPMSEFNSDFNSLHYVDPQNLSNAGSPSYNPNTTLTPDFTPDAYPQDFGSTPGSPYFQSIEQSFGAPFIPTQLPTQHLHRRSVSEPPDGSVMHHFPQLDSPVIFHRDGHNLGMPRSNAPQVKKLKASHVQPYQRSQRQQPPPQSRYQLRRAYTQSSRLPPTSAPVGMNANTPPPLQRMIQHRQRQGPFDHELQFVSSRVCTPAPEAVDPFLAASSAPVAPQATSSGHSHVRGAGLPQDGVQGHNELAHKSVVIEMGVEELRALVTEAVQKAVEGLQVANKSAESGTGDDVDDEIVVAGCSNGEIDKV